MKIRLKQDKKTIFKLLANSGIKRRLKIIDRLNGVNERDSINILLKVLEDSSWIMREKAAYKLSKYGSKVVPRLKRLLKRGYWYTRSAACLSLGEIGNLKALPSIIDLILNDQNPTVIKEASTAFLKLAQKKTPEFIDALTELAIKEQDRQKLLALIKKQDPGLYDVIIEGLEHG